MKHLMYSFLALAVVACAPTSRDAGTTSGASSPAAAQETASVAPAPEPAPVAKPADEQKPLSYYTDKVAELHTTAGDIHIRFFADVAPNHVRNFIDLAERGFYNGTKFHRVIPGFVIQGGDPNSISGDPSTWGTGNSGKTVALEPSSIHHARGIVSMARGGHDINSASSQFFVCVADAPNLDGGYSAFGQVTKGMDVVDKIVLAPAERTRPVNPESITSITIRPATDAEKGPAPTQ